MPSHRRVARRIVSAPAIAVVAIAIASCSDGGPASFPIVTAESSVGPTASDVASASRSDSQPRPELGTGRVPGVEVDTVAPFAVSVSVVMADAAIDTSLDVVFDPSDLVDIDPFARFASCSGLRTSVGAYSVLVSDPAGDLLSVSLLSAARIEGPGTYDADLRIEPVSGEAIVAAGTITIGVDLRSGSYVAFDAGGRRVSGSFFCEGAKLDASPLTPGGDDRVLETIEVFVLLGRHEAQRVVGLAIEAANTGIDAECPGAEGVFSRALVRVDGDQSVGAMTTFEIGDGASSSMRLRVGSVSFEFDDVDLSVEEDRTSGTFSAKAADGVSADGAFFCT